MVKHLLQRGREFHHDLIFQAQINLYLQHQQICKPSFKKMKGSKSILLNTKDKSNAWKPILMISREILISANFSPSFSLLLNYYFPPLFHIQIGFNTNFQYQSGRRPLVLREQPSMPDFVPMTGRWAKRARSWRRTYTLLLESLVLYST